MAAMEVMVALEDAPVAMNVSTEVPCTLPALEISQWDPVQVLWYPIPK